MSTTTVTESPPAYKQKATAKREKVYEKIPKEWRLSEPLPTPKNTYDYLKTSGILSADELAITETTEARVLLNKLATKQLSAVDVTKAFSKRAATAHQLIKCCTEMFLDEAIEAAKGLDEYLAKEGKLMGPLHGLPVSIKDGFDVEGYDSTLGWVSMIDKPAARDCNLVVILKKLGAVIYCKTNVPQSLMMSDSYNHVFKQSTNAFDNQLISGGSSGGEGALVGCRGSLVGIGTDIGGSVRIPASLQGLYGLSPTTGRVPMDKSGQRSYIVPPVAGPLTNDLRTLETFMDALASVGRPWEYESFAPPLPWRKELAAKPDRPLKIGYFVDDGFCRCQPPLEVAVNKAVEALKAAGHEVVPWSTDLHAEGDRLWLKGVLANGGKAYRAEADRGGEPTIPGMLTGELEDELDVDQSNALHKEIRTYQQTYLRRFHEAGLDAILQPTQSYVAYKPKTWVKASCHVGYTSLWNLMDWAGLVFPMGVAEPDNIDTDAEPGDGRASWSKHEPRNESDRFNKEQYDPELVRGKPVTVQLVCGKYGEEKCVSVAKALEDAMRVYGK